MIESVEVVEFKHYKYVEFAHLSNGDVWKRRAQRNHKLDWEWSEWQKIEFTFLKQYDICN